MAMATAASRISPMNASDAPLTPRFFFERDDLPAAGPSDFCRFVRFRFFDMVTFCRAHRSHAMHATVSRRDRR